MAVKIKLKRLGKIHAPQYRIVIADSRTARNGRSIEEIGIYQPMDNPSIIRVDSDRVQYWLGVGAQPTEAVAAILKVTGDWQKFKGLPGAEGTLQVAEPKPSKTIAFEAAVQAAAKEPKSTPKPKLEKAVEAVEAAAATVVADVEKVAHDVVAAVEGLIHHEHKADEAAAETVVVETVVEDAAPDAVVEETVVEAVADATDEVQA